MEPMRLMAAACAQKAIPIVPGWYKYLQCEGDGRTVQFNLQAPDDFVRVGLAIFEIVLRIGGIVAVVFVIYGGFLYLTSMGEPDKAKNGRTTIINALVGLAIATFATALVNLVGRNI